ncbi:MBL fold metallo-hydrolase [Uliginosibacterium sediminicola]|uniref:MBL fold metallo-hydrolase n=1 Tax=Uliginosibacterium sediminicola TaxID=2024550 RepID=A0ABU9Z140_9RHOO
MKRSSISLTLATLGLLAASSAGAAGLSLEVYNPGDKAIFPVSSTIIAGAHEVILVDAQFQRNDAEALVQKIKASGKTLSTVYISHGDPDFYFGLDVIQAAFPAAKILATAPTVEHIKATMDGKLAYWGPILKNNAPQKLVLPEVIKGDTLKLEGQRISIKGLKSAAPERSYLWIPSLKTVTGGINVFSATHVWIADTQSPQSRQNWQATLNSIAALKPVAVVPGHYLGAAPKGLAAVKFTSGYIQKFEAEAAKAKDSAELIGAMKTSYPDVGEPASLEISAKVIKGEMKW